MLAIVESHDSYDTDADIKGWFGLIPAGSTVVDVQKLDPIAPGSSHFVPTDRRFPVHAADMRRGGNNSAGKPEIDLINKTRSRASDQRPRFELSTSDRDAMESMMSQ